MERFGRAGGRWSHSDIGNGLPSPSDFKRCPDVESSNMNAHRACREQHQTGSAFTHPQPAFDFTGSRLVAVAGRRKPWIAPSGGVERLHRLRLLIRFLIRFRAGSGSPFRGFSAAVCRGTSAGLLCSSCRFWQQSSWRAATESIDWRRRLGQGSDRIEWQPRIGESRRARGPQWRYSPYQVQGSPVEVETQIKMSFFGPDAVSITSVAKESTSQPK